MGIARNPAVKPDLWSLDEPFSKLDPLIPREVQEEFLRIQRKLTMTILFITHDFDEAIRLADRIAIMKDGAAVQVATPEELALSPADACVAAFTAPVARAKVVNPGRIAAPGVPDGIAGSRPSDARIEVVAERIVTANAPICVTGDGTVIGQVTPAPVIDVLIGKRE